MAQRTLVTAWLWLVALAIGTALLTRVDGTGPGRGIVTAAVLALAGVKARIIVASYLGLRDSRFWMTAFDMALAGLLATALGLALSARA